MTYEYNVTALIMPLYSLQTTVVILNGHNTLTCSVSVYPHALQRHPSASAIAYQYRITYIEAAVSRDEVHDNPWC